MKPTNIIIGAGIAGLGAAYALRKKGEDSLVLEKDETWGGLCGCFEKDGFRFDRFVHLSFSKDEEVNSIFFQTPIFRHTPNPMNIYHGQWIKHPAQNNLYPLPEEEKRLVIDDFMKRKPADEVMNGGKANYEDWLRCQFGDYFAEHFPMAYTRKYWMKEARQLRTEWVGNRLYQPSVDEVIAGSKAEDTRVTYYAKEMRYPQHGGFRAFFEPLAREARIQYRTRVTAIDPKERVVTDSEGRTYKYKRLITSAPPCRS
jgi:protoporphyrinogen oxidase